MRRRSRSSLSIVEGELRAQRAQHRHWTTFEHANNNMPHDWGVFTHVAHDRRIHCPLRSLLRSVSSVARSECDSSTHVAPIMRSVRLEQHRPECKSHKFDHTHTHTPLDMYVSESMALAEKELSECLRIDKELPFFLAPLSRGGRPH